MSDRPGTASAAIERVVRGSPIAGRAYQLRAESSVKLTKYSYHGVEDGTERAIIDLLKGGLRSVTGAIGRTNKDSYQLRNDMHVIGIRVRDPAGKPVIR